MGRRLERALTPQGLILGGVALIAAAVLGLSVSGTLQFTVVPQAPSATGPGTGVIGGPPPWPASPYPSPSGQPAPTHPAQPSPGRSVRLVATSAPPGTSQPGGAGGGTGGGQGGPPPAAPSPPVPSARPSTPVPVRTTPPPATLPPSPVPAPQPAGVCVSVLGVRACLHL